MRFSTFLVASAATLVAASFEESDDVAPRDLTEVEERDELLEERAKLIRPPNIGVPSHITVPKKKGRSLDERDEFLGGNDHLEERGSKDGKGKGSAPPKRPSHTPDQRPRSLYERGGKDGKGKGSAPPKRPSHTPDQRPRRRSLYARVTSHKVKSPPQPKPAHLPDPKKDRKEPNPRPSSKGPGHHRRSLYERGGEKGGKNPKPRPSPKGPGHHRRSLYTRVSSGKGKSSSGPRVPSPDPAPKPGPPPKGKGRK